VGAYVMAVCLPALATWTIMHLHLFDTVPGAVYLAIIALTAWFGYGMPVVVCTLLSLVLINYYLAPPIYHWSLLPVTLFREATLGLLSGLVGYLIVRNKKVRIVQAQLIERAQAAEAEMRKLLSDYEEQAEAFALAQQAGKSASWVLDVSTRKVRWLPGGFEVFGRPASEYLEADAPINAVFPEDIPGIEAALQRTLATGVPFQPEFRVIWPNGEMHWQEARGILDPENPHLIRGTTFDLTDRKNADMSLLRVEKLAAVGRIASTIAHEINNPLAAVTNLLYLAAREPSLEATRNYLETAQQELSRLSNIARLTLSYARVQKTPSEVDPMEVVDGVLFLFRERLRAKSIQVERVNARVPLRISIFSDELQRIVTNLVANAIDALSSTTGRLRISLEGRDAEVLLAVEDNGCGIAEDHLDRIFEPFFTTKEETGTGIGLWVTKELVEKNGGSIRLHSGPHETGMRTRFEVRFPAVLRAGKSGFEATSHSMDTATSEAGSANSSGVLSGFIETR
jgi:signal transduction histidine kinase